ncbi:uncharacterized protein LOC134207181 [Armigeres subalbatus]|uniref:uncharacterized protein LOC134207181 n=1 Tax=Armigeres subalbatus TaxID=124917 RepID=UPI002ED207DF
MSALTNNLKRKPGERMETLKKGSPVYKSSPVLDDEGVLRMDGRLAESSFDKNHPIILSRFHDVTHKLIQHYHNQFGHANSETVFNEMRQRFQIPKMRPAIQQVVNKCFWCRVKKCRPCSPRMAPLPVERITARQRPFSSVGVDYLGPVKVAVGRRNGKRWVAVFTCMAVRAVHLEVVHSLSTESCRMAITRFQSKFGRPSQRRVRRSRKQFDYRLAFHSAGTPHMGGVWERMVRSVKETMRALDDGRKLTDEILVTTLAEANIINTHPLTYLPQDSDETETLTPNHLIRGTVSGADVKMDGRPTDPAKTLRNMLKRSQFLADRMWERWCKEYLPTINQRSKWFDEQKPLQDGDLVFVVDGKNRKSWRRGVIEAVIKGTDGRVR